MGMTVKRASDKRRGPKGLKSQHIVVYSDGRVRRKYITEERAATLLRSAAVKQIDKEADSPHRDKFLRSQAPTIGTVVEDLPSAPPLPPITPEACIEYHDGHHLPDDLPDDATEAQCTTCGTTLTREPAASYEDDPALEGLSDEDRYNVLRVLEESGPDLVRSWASEHGIDLEGTDVEVAIALLEKWHANHAAHAAAKAEEQTQAPEPQKEEGDDKTKEAETPAKRRRAARNKQRSDTPEDK